MKYAAFAPEVVLSHADTDPAFPISGASRGRLETIARITNFKPWAAGIAPSREDRPAPGSLRARRFPAVFPLLRGSGHRTPRQRDPEPGPGTLALLVSPPPAEGAEPERCPAVSDEDGGALAELTLDLRGVIGDCNGAAERLFGCRRDHLLGQPVSRVLPELPEDRLCQAGRINPSLLYRCHIGAPFRACPISARSFACLLSLVSVGPATAPQIRVVLQRRRGG